MHALVSAALVVRTWFAVEKVTRAESSHRRRQQAPFALRTFVFTKRAASPSLSDCLQGCIRKFYHWTTAPVLSLIHI